MFGNELNKPVFFTMLSAGAILIGSVVKNYEKNMRMRVMNIGGVE
jgi:hypothetical protein